MDLAEGHRENLNCLLAEASRLLTLNLVSGQGQPELEVVQGMEAILGHSIQRLIIDCRPGDATNIFTSLCKASQRLGGGTQRGLADICRDGWALQQNPEGNT